MSVSIAINSIRSGTLILFLFLGFLVKGQENNTDIVGEVTFITSSNAYVKFPDMESIEIGDSLFIDISTNSACLVVKQKSSTSSVCQILEGCSISTGDFVTKRKQSKKETEIIIEEEIPIDKSEEEEIVQAQNLNPITEEKSPLFQERIRGRISAASYSRLSSLGNDRHRLMGRFSLSANHIGNSKFSVETYLNYRQNFIQSGESSGRETQFFRVYNLAVKYDLDSTMSIVVGRKINAKTASIGAIDGLQVEKHFGPIYVGAIGGFRPDIFAFGFNSDLLQYGGYLGIKSNGKNFYTTSTFGLLEQRNKGNIDRRYAYFQHSSSLFKKLSLFGSFEMDLYEKINDVVGNNIRLTNLFVSARYRFNRKVNITLSYDTRKRILFYETLKTEIERLIDDDEARQGIRARINIRPIKYLSVGASFGKRFQSSLQNKSENINGFISLSRVPKINGRLSLNFNLNTSSYLQSRIISVRHSRSFLKKKLGADFYFRNVNYSYLSSEVQFAQNYFGANFHYRFSKKFSFAILGELAIREGENNTRVNFKVTRRFGE